MKSVAIGNFKDRCLALLEQVRSTHEKLVITRRGKPIAQVLPISEPEHDELTYLRGTLLMERDIVSPTGEAWEADR